MMQLELTDKDFESVLSAADISRMRPETTGQRTLAAGDRKSVIEALPKALAKKLEEMLPEGFHIRSLKMDLDLSVSFFGSGFGGTVGVEFGPRD